MTIRGEELTLTLCILLGIVSCDFLPEGNQVSVDGLANHSVTLPCSFIIPDNWKDNEANVIWYRNLTHKLLNCTVRHGEGPVCQKSPDASGMRISWKFFGNADMEIAKLRISDAGHYECWLILNEAYQRQDTQLRVHDDAAPERDVPGSVSMGTMGALCVRNLLQVSGWITTLILIGVLLSQRRRHHRKIIYSVI